MTLMVASSPPEADCFGKIVMHENRALCNSKSTKTVYLWSRLFLSNGRLFAVEMFVDRGHDLDNEKNDLHKQQRCHRGLTSFLLLYWICDFSRENPTRAWILSHAVGGIA
ncbi:hypothetical protein [Rhizobium leguminosarum]